VKAKFRCRSLGMFALKGKQNDVSVFEVEGLCEGAEA
jgi:hypothetical protein